MPGGCWFFEPGLYRDWAVQRKPWLFGLYNGYIMDYAIMIKKHKLAQIWEIHINHYKMYESTVGTVVSVWKV